MESISSLYVKYQDQTVLSKSKEFAKYTIPSLMVDPTQRHTNAEVLDYDYQSIGALYVNNLTAKLVMALFPSGRSSFQISLTEELKTLLETEYGDDAMLIKASTAELERLATEQTFKNAALSKLFRVVKLLIVTGQCLVYRDSALQTYYVWNLNNYVTRRDMSGRVTRGILKQVIPAQELPQSILDDLQKQQYGVKADTIVTQYTDIRYELTPSGRRAVVQNYINDKPVGAEASYPEHLCPYVFPSWDVPSGEHYARGYVEEYAGDFARLSLLSTDVSLYEGEILHLLNLVDEAGGSAIDDVTDKPTGSYVPGRTESISSFEKGDYNKLNSAYQGLEGVSQRLAMAFMYTGSMRQAERVTAEEVRQVATEAENLLGGAYSVLAENLQAPLAYLSMYEVSKDNPDLLAGIILQHYRPVIITGIPALTAATETQNLTRATSEISQILPVVMELMPAIDPNKVGELIMLNNGVDVDALRKSSEQLAQEQEAAAAEAEAEQAALSAEAEVNLDEVEQEF